MNSENSYIPRKLCRVDQENQYQSINDDDLLTEKSSPIVILGEPGMGKTRLMKRLGESENCKFFRATSFIRQSLHPSIATSRLVIDGLDEIATLETGDPLHNVLKKLIEFGRPSFIISCRSAEWNGVNSRINIEEEYGCNPEIFQLQQFTEHQATEALACAVGQEKARNSIERLKSSGLETFFDNPLNLDFITTILKKQDFLPETKTELLQSAVSALRLEPNPTHSQSALSELSEEESLDAAGCLMASMLITGNDCISKTQIGEGILCLSDVSDLTKLQSAKAILGSRLFRTDKSTHQSDSVFFIPLHRTVAEFLGARWISYELNKKQYQNRTSRRLLNLISEKGGIPASLRGIHAWLAKFSPEILGPMVIKRDPYGVLRYADGDHLTLEQAKSIINELKQLADDDPFFRRDWRDPISTKGLAQRELIEDIRKIISSDEYPFHLRSLLLEAVSGQDIAPDLVNDLEKIIFDKQRLFRERWSAADAVCRITGQPHDWSDFLNRLIDLGDWDSSRLAIDLILEFGIEKISSRVMARAVAADSGILGKLPDEDSRTLHDGPYILARLIPDYRIVPLLDELTDIISRDNQEEWWERGYRKKWMLISYFSEKLISRQLQSGNKSIRPEKLWNWMSRIWTNSGSQENSIASVSEIISTNDQLRLALQRLALFSKGTEENIHFLIHQLPSFCDGLSVTEQDARIHLAELVERNDSSEKERWKTLVRQLRNEKGLVPDDIKKIARPYAWKDSDLIDFLNKKPTRSKRTESEKKYRRRIRDGKKRNKEESEERRLHYMKHIEEVRRGELRWIFDPARAYLGLFGDFDDNNDPSARISKWFGDEIRDAATAGFDAVLTRSDLPNTAQVAGSYAERKSWNYVTPMLAGIVRRHLNKQDPNQLPVDLVSSMLIAIDHDFSGITQQFQGLRDSLEKILKEGGEIYEKHLRDKIEPMLSAGISRIQGLYKLVMDETERRLSVKLCLEWLEKYTDLPLDIEKQLANCIIHSIESERTNAWKQLTEIADQRVKSSNPESDNYKFWQSVQFLIDFETVTSQIPIITTENRDMLWSLTECVYRSYHHGTHDIPVSVQQLKWIVSNFRGVWPFEEHPNEPHFGINNPWDATELLGWAINRIGNVPSDEAASALLELRNEPPDGYTITIKSTIAENQRKQIEARFTSPSLSDLKAVLANQFPRSESDVQAIVVDELFYLQNKLYGHPLNFVNDYYDDNWLPRKENDCRDQMVKALGNLPFRIEFSRESSMPQDKRSDGCFSYSGFKVPLEVKGQWNKDVWISPSTQLDRLYLVSEGFQTKGIYVVFWFGENVPKNKKLKQPPEPIPKPESTDEMGAILKSLIPQNRRDDIEIVVLDVKRP